MANQEHLAILKQGVQVWNDWRKKNPEIKPDLEGADLIGLNLVEENKIEGNISSLNSELIFHEQKIREIYFKPSILGIRDINFSSSNLRRFNFREANLFGVNLFGANLEGTNLQEADIRYADLRETNFLGADLLGANLSYAKLFGANLGQTTLTSVDFTEADLRSCILWSANAIYANFHKAILTGACIQDWNINKYTNLEGVICDYIYLMLPEQERRPSDTTKIFGIGDFERLIKKTRETVDLIFNEEINWGAFLTSFKNLKVESDYDLSVESIRQTDDGTLIIGIKTSAIKKEVESSFWKLYQPIIDEKERHIKFLQEELQFNKQNNSQIIQNNNQLTQIIKIIEVMVEKENNQNNTYNLQGANFGGGFAGNDYLGNVINNYNENKLNETVKDIQSLIDKLSEKSSSETTTQQMQIATEIITTIENDLDWKQRAIAAAQQGLLEMIKNHPIGAFVAGAIESWRSSK